MSRFLRKIKRKACRLMRFCWWLLRLFAVKLWLTCQKGAKAVVGWLLRLPRPTLARWRELFLELALSTKTFFGRLKQGLSQELKGKQGNAEDSKQTLNPAASLVPTEKQDAEAVNGEHRKVFGLQELFFSTARFSRHVRMLWTRRAMAACALGVAVCLLLLPLLSLPRVKRVRIEGNVLHTEQEIVSLVGSLEGEGLYSFSVRSLAKELEEGLDLLASANVRRRARTVCITLTEYDIRWALALADGRYALLNDGFFVPRICTEQELPAGVCRLQLDAADVTVESEQGKHTLSQGTISVGQTIQTSSTTAALLKAMPDALSSTALPYTPVLLDVRDLYNVTLYLEDGSILCLYECTDAQRSLRAIDGAIRTYLSSRPTDGQTPLLVTIDDDFRISIRPNVKNGQ